MVPMINLAHNPFERRSPGHLYINDASEMESRNRLHFLFLMNALASLIFFFSDPPGYNSLENPDIKQSALTSCLNSMELKKAYLKDEKVFLISILIAIVDRLPGAVHQYRTSNKKQ